MCDYENNIETINEIEKFDEIIQIPRYRMCCRSLLEFLKAVCYYLKNVKKSKKAVFLVFLVVVKGNFITKKQRQSKKITKQQQIQ